MTASSHNNGYKIIVCAMPNNTFGVQIFQLTNGVCTLAPETRSAIFLHDSNVLKPFNTVTAAKKAAHAEMKRRNIPAEWYEIEAPHIQSLYDCVIAEDEDNPGMFAILIWFNNLTPSGCPRPQLYWRTVQEDKETLGYLYTAEQAMARAKEVRRDFQQELGLSDDEFPEPALPKKKAAAA